MKMVSQARAFSVLSIKKVKYKEMETFYSFLGVRERALIGQNSHK